MRISDWSSDVCSSDLLEHVENGDPVWQGDTVAMLFGDGAGDMAGFAEAKPAAAQPDEIFNYSSATSVILSDIIADTLTPSPNPAARRDAMLGFIDGRLIEPPGKGHLAPEVDAKGTLTAGLDKTGRTACGERRGERVWSW